MIKMQLENVKEFEFKFDALLLKGKNFEIELEDEGFDSQELAIQLIEDLTHKLYQKIHADTNEAKAKEVVKYVLESIVEETLNDEILEYAKG